MATRDCQTDCLANKRDGLTCDGRPHNGKKKAHNKTYVAMAARSKTESFVYLCGGRREIETMSCFRATAHSPTLWAIVQGYVKLIP